LIDPFRARHRTAAADAFALAIEHMSSGLPRDGGHQSGHRL
jgi:hypothetical protein